MAAGSPPARDREVAVRDIQVGVPDMKVAVRDGEVPARDMGVAVRDREVPVRDTRVGVRDMWTNKWRRDWGIWIGEREDSPRRRRGRGDE